MTTGIAEKTPTVVHAPAKLNLFLSVLGRRADGYHDIETVMVAVDLCDTLRFRVLEEPVIRLRVHRAAPRTVGRMMGWERIPCDENNLVWRAARLLQSHAGTRRGVAIELLKRIPPQSGLGGGSSDAAAALLTLNRLWNLNLPQQRLRELAAALGSDVPFFTGQYTAAVCRGRGQHVEPIAGPLGLYFVIARPPAGLSTADVYRGCDTTPGKRVDFHWLQCLRRAPLRWLARSTWNGLLASARRLSVEVEQTLASLRRAGGPVVGMSGSGTACFACCRHLDEARALAARLAAQRQLFVAVARTCCAGSSVRRSVR
ncbi:MAG: 4-(cytidine 5'-diphospho)-2-C-methyl-D-erythritol kinase [Planctomycetota bacterium]|nr:MAG: 4-(cytidine 5'-diphospho)-2-C-methyl-D-erythritol kinase [Planctomycetota bacterium]